MILKNDNIWTQANETRVQTLIDEAVAELHGLESYNCIEIYVALKPEIAKL